MRWVTLYNRIMKGTDDFAWEIMLRIAGFSFGLFVGLLVIRSYFGFEVAALFGLSALVITVGFIAVLIAIKATKS